MAVAAGRLGGGKIGQISGVAVALGCEVAVGVAEDHGVIVWSFATSGGLPPPKPQAFSMSARVTNTPAASKVLTRR